MAAFRAQANGDIVQFLSTYLQEKQIVWNQAAFPYQSQFDEATNPGLIAAWSANPAQFRMDGGTLTQNNIAVTINPPQPLYDAFLHAAEMLAKGLSDNPPAPTAQEQWRAIFLSFRNAGLV